MVKIPNKLIIFGALAAAALAVPGVLGPLMLEEAYADQRATCKQRENVVAACVQAQVDDVCVGILATQQRC